MKIKRSRLRRIIKEELSRIVEAKNPTDPEEYNAWFKKNYVDWLAGMLKKKGMELGAEEASRLTWQEWHGHEAANLERVKAAMSSLKPLDWTMISQQDAKGVMTQILRRVPYDSGKGTK